MTHSLQKLNISGNRRPLLVLFLVFAAVQVALYSRIGVFTDLEAAKYVEQGNLLYDTGHFSDSKYIFYLPVILLVYLCRWLGASLFLVVLFQSLLSGLSLYLFYRLADQLGNKTTAFLSGLLLCVFVPLQSWNFRLFSDSIFISLTVIYSFLVFKYGQRGLSGTLIILLFLGMLIFSRPHGLLIIPPTIIYLLFRKQTSASRAISLLLCLLLLAGMYFLLNAAFTGGGDMDAMKPFIEEHIICFVPMKPEGAHLDLSNTANPVYDLFYYVIHNPLHFLRLMVLKLVSFFNITRPYYSTMHNIFLACFIIPLYIFSIEGVRRLCKLHRQFSWFLVSLLVLYPLGATFQCDDWHSRFTMVMFPYFILLGCLGFYSIFGKKPAASS